VGEPEVIDIDNNMDEDDPEEDKNDKTMDEDGKKLEMTSDHPHSELPHCDRPAPGSRSHASQQHTVEENVQHFIESATDSSAAVVKPIKKPVIVLKALTMQTLS